MAKMIVEMDQTKVTYMPAENHHLGVLMGSGIALALQNAVLT
jgi:hypothetical protein